MAKFCGKCGSPLNPQTGRCPVCGAVYAPPIQPQPAHPPVREDVPPVVKPKKRRTALWIVLGAVAALLIAAAVVGVLAHFGVIDIPQVIKLEKRLGIPTRRVMVRLERYDADGEMESYSENEYNSKGQRVRSDSYGLTWDEGHTYGIYEYDAEGREIGEKWYDSDGSCSKRNAMEYNDEGQMTKYLGYTGDGGLTGYSTYEYDSNGRLIKSSEYNNADVMEYYDVCEYNDEGQMVKRTYYTWDGRALSYTAYEYNDEGLAEKKIFYDETGTESGYKEFKYNKDGDLVRETS